MSFGGQSRNGAQWLTIVSTERIIFANAFESLRKVLPGELPPQLNEQLIALGVNFARLAPAYPLPTWRQAIELFAQQGRTLPLEDAAYFEMGRALVTHYGDSLIGKALLSAMQVIGPTRALKRLARSFRTTNNFSEATIVDVAPTHYRVTLNEVAHPQFERGVLTEGMVRAGATDVRVSLTATAPMVEYEVRWGP